MERKTVVSMSQHIKMPSSRVGSEAGGCTTGAFGKENEVKSSGVFPKIEVVPDAETGYTPRGYANTNVKSFDAL